MRQDDSGDGRRPLTDKEWSDRLGAAFQYGVEQSFDIERFRSAVSARIDAAERGGQEHAPMPAPVSAPVSASMPAARRSRSSKPIGAFAGACATATAFAAVALVFGVWRYARSTEAPSQSYATHVGERKLVQLPDGTRVMLAPRTRLVVAAGFGARTREMALTGEAFFDVRHQSSTPFIVHTGRIATRVVGTSFDVQHYGEAPVQISVATGKVSIERAAHTPVVLVAGNVGHVTDSTTIITTGVDVQSGMSWANGPHAALVFKGTPLPDALRMINNWYGLDVRIGDTAIASSHLSGTFTKETRAEVLTALKNILDVGMQFDEMPGRAPVVTLVKKQAGEGHTRVRRSAPEFTHTSTEVGR
jgi:transmembrane sensor